MAESFQGAPLVYSFQDTPSPTGNSAVGQYLYSYLTAIRARTFVKEEDYIDKDYLIDYAKFYARSFDIHKKYTTRYHFFAIKFTDDEFKEALRSGNKAFFNRLERKYLGFVVIKPIKDIHGHYLIGKTVLATYPLADGEEQRVYLRDRVNVSLFGVHLEIESTPFQVHDAAVGACATIACWTSLFPLTNLFGIQAYSPSEVTEKSVSFPSDSRNFPSDGLTITQMKNYFNSIGLETDFIDPKEIVGYKDYTSHDDIIADAVRAHLHLGLPIIAGLDLMNDGKPSGYHAVVITGYKHKNGNLTELYTHDDNIGPYCYVKPDPTGKLHSWVNEWLESGYEEVQVQRLLIPVYPKIRLSFSRIYGVYLYYKRTSKLQIESGNLDEDTKIELFLTDIKEYKKFLSGMSFSTTFKDKTVRDKVTTLCKPFPRFIWVFRFQCYGTPHFDYIFDGTSVYPNLVADITYCHDNGNDRFTTVDTRPTTHRRSPARAPQQPRLRARLRLR